MSDDTEQLVQELAARHAIADVIHAYARALDRLDRALLASLFHAGAEVDYGNIYRGAASGFIEVAMGFQGAMRSTQHQVSNMQIALERERAAAESYVLAYHVLEEDGALFELLVGARYLDRLALREGSWKITFRTEVMDWARRVPLTDRWFDDNDELPKGRRDREDPSYQFLPPITD